MRKTIQSLIVALALLCFVSCGDDHSKAYRIKEKEANELQKKIEETSDCDDLRLFSFSILGLQGDVENLKDDELLKDGEIEALKDMVSRIESFWNNKINTMDCKEPTDEESELDTTAEDDFTDYDII